MIRAVAVLALVACGESKRAEPEPSQPAAELAPAVASEAAGLPGVIWFVEEGPPKRLVRISGGARRAWKHPAGDLYPSAWTLPDGRLVAISSRGDGSAGSEQLALVPLAGDVQPAGPAAAQVRDPAVDRRGRWIVVAANTDGHSDLYRIDLAAAKTTRITDDPAGNFAPAVLDDDAIVFVSSRDGDSEIYRMPAAGGKPQRLTAFHRDDWQPAVSPDGKTIAFTSDREGRPRIFLMAADGTGQRRLTARRDKDLDELDPAWSPDGRSIAYVVQAPGLSQVWVHDVAAGEGRAATPAGTRDAEPSWSPDGAWLAVSRGGEHDSELWAVPVAGGKAIQVTRSKGADQMPRWLTR